MSWLLNTQERRLCGPKSWSGCFGAEKNLLPLPGFEPQIVELVEIDIPTMCDVFCSISLHN
jgi:hypothetical protein